MGRTEAGGVMSINRVAVSGRLAKDAELRATSGGTDVCSFRLAVSDRIKSGSEWTDHTNWVDVTLFGARAVKLAPMLTKGSKVVVEGKLRYSEWATDSGRRSKIEIIADEIELMTRLEDRTADDGDEIPF
jgi:single-strand DNA-binding protein